MFFMTFTTREREGSQQGERELPIGVLGAAPRGWRPHAEGQQCPSRLLTTQLPKKSCSSNSGGMSPVPFSPLESSCCGEYPTALLKNVCRVSNWGVLSQFTANELSFLTKLDVFNGAKSWCVTVQVLQHLCPEPCVHLGVLHMTLPWAL